MADLQSIAPVYRCKTHPTYGARREPRSPCATCLAIFTRHQMLSRAVREAGDRIAALIPDQTITVTAECSRGIPSGRGTYTSAWRAEVYPIRGSRG